MNWLQKISHKLQDDVEIITQGNLSDAEAVRLLEHGHGIKHYQCGHTEKCRCVHGGQLEYNVAIPCYECKNGKQDF